MTASDTPENSASFLAVMARPSSAAASRRWQVARSAGLMSSSARGTQPSPSRVTAAMAYRFPRARRVPVRPAPPVPPSGLSPRQNSTNPV